MKRSFIGVWLATLANVLSPAAMSLSAAAAASAAPAVSDNRRTRYRGKGKPGKAGDKLKRLAAEGRLGLRH